MIRKKLGFVKRGIVGFFYNKLEKVPNIPSGVNKFEIGKTVSSNPINCYQINQGNKKVIFISGLHGNEIGTVKLSHNLLKWLYKNREQLNQFTFYITPCLNVDGYNKAVEHPDYFNGGKIGRFNANNVDLNRNFNTPGFKSESVWSSGKDYSEKEKVFCGKYGGSEPETRSLVEFIKNNDIKVAYFFHNAGKDVMGNNSQLSQKLVKLYCQKTGFRYVSDEEWKTMNQTGTAKEWCEINNIAYIEVEGSTRWGTDWEKQREAIIATINKINTYDQNNS